MAIILGVDPSLANTGLVVIDTETFTLVYQTTIKNPAGSSANYSNDPYAQIRGGIRTVVRAYKVEYAFVEQMFAGRNPNIAELLFCSAFMARYTLWEEGVPVTVMPISGPDRGWRWFTLGADYSKYKGGQLKVVNKSALMTALRQKIGNEHQADATGIALAGWFFMTGEDFRDKLGAEKPQMYKEKETKNGTSTTAKRTRKPAKRATT